jgi:hypothetical protein
VAFFDLVTPRKFYIKSKPHPVVSQQEKQKPTVAVAHETLLTSWQTLQDWIKEDQENIILKNRLIDDAKNWQNLRTKDPQQANSELWSGSKLERVLEQRGKLPFSNLSQEVNQFIDASVAWRDEESQRQLKQERKARKILTYSLVGLTGLTGFAFYQWNEAQKNTINALAQTSEASLLSNRQLEAMVAAVQADRRLKNPFLFPDAATSQNASAALQRAVYSVQEHNRLEGHSAPVWSVVFSPDGKTLASGSVDRSIKLWDVATGKVINTLNGHSNWVYSVVFSPDGKTLASGSQDNSIKLWDVATGKVIHTLNGHSHWVYSVVFSPDGKTLASGSQDNSIKLWKLYPNNLKDLMTHSCDLLRGYLQTNPNVSNSDRHLCDGIGTQIPPAPQNTTGG